MTRNCSYFSVPYARTNAYYYSFSPHMLCFWNSLPSTLAQAPEVFKRLLCLRFTNYISYAILWTIAVCRNFCRKKVIWKGFCSNIMLSTAVQLLSTSMPSFSALYAVYIHANSCSYPNHSTIAQPSSWYYNYYADATI